jgi:3-hydroxyisobutyrate dehydrogenase-like beta-hydroxyacid dehydrogenase
MQHVGFVGVGNQGGPIAHRIRAGGFPLTVWARRPQVLDELAAAGAIVAVTLAELGACSDVVGICVTTDDDVRDVVLGPSGLLSSMRAGSVVAIHSTVHPDTVRAIARAAASSGVRVVDAPVSGGRARAMQGQLTVLLGGDDADIAWLRPVLATYASTTEVLGGVGAAQLAKLVNNAAAAANLGTSLAALDAATELGLDRAAMQRVLESSSGDSFMLRAVPAMDDTGTALAAARLDKDARLLREAAGMSRRAIELADAAVAAVRTVHDLGR